MAKTFLTSIDLNRNQLIKAVIENLASAPGTPAEGQIYYNTTDKTIYVRLAATWLDLGAGGVTDGTYGDITVSAGGTVFTVVADAITYAKIQNVVANNVILGNNAGAGGIVKELTATEVRTIINVTDGADATNSTTVNAAGAVMESDISATPSGRIINDNTMATASATTLATSLSIKTYVDGVITGGTFYKGGYNAATNTPNLDVTPIANSIGSMYTVTADGAFFTENVQIGDVLIAEIANPTTLADWTIVNKNIPDIVSSSETAQGIIELATQAEVNTGTDVVRAVTPATLQSKLGITATLNSAVRFTQAVGTGAATTIVVTHNIGRQFVTAQIFQTLTPFAQVECDIEMTSTTTTTFRFNVAPTSNQYTVVIIG